MYVEVIIPISVPKTFTYKVPCNLNFLKVGSRVVVPFKGKSIVGVVDKKHSIKPDYKTKDILEVLDNTPIFNLTHLKFFRWISEYYMCNIGDVLRIALPSGLKIKSESILEINPNYKLNICDNLSDNQKALLEKLNINKKIYIKDIEESEKKEFRYLLKNNLVKTKIYYKEKYKPKLESIIALNKIYFENVNQKELFDKLTNKPKQLHIILEYFKYVSMNPNKNENTFVSVNQIFKNINLSKSSLNTLIKNEIFVQEYRSVSRLKLYTKKIVKFHILNKIQENALLNIKKHFRNNSNIVLLHGITGSGKTEIYISLIENYLNKNKKVLFLIPEIALTTQIVQRVESFFGDKMNVYHSKYSENERIEVWNNVKNNNVNLVLGTRSAIFLPFNQLDLVIIDEEHDYSYKQKEPSPRYNARDSIIFLSKIFKNKVLLGSATPSLESYYNANIGKYELVEIKERYKNVELPNISLIDMKKKYSNTFNKISKKLLDKIKIELDKKKQILLFQNLRGYSQYIICTDCGWIPYCNICDVSYTLHLKKGKIICHYCSKEIFYPKTCIVCGSTNLDYKGIGTQKIEDILEKEIPNVKIIRIDYDSTRKKNAFEKIIDKIQKKKVDIVVGTQMITKGLDFDNISLVGIIDSDKIINLPDYRSKEKAFQTITQVGGRAGRKEQGEVLIQTYNPKQNIFNYISKNSYKDFFEKELLERKLFSYPPINRLIKVIFKGKNQSLVKNISNLFALHLKKNNYIYQRTNILGPQEPLVSKIKNFFFQNIWIKLKNIDSLPLIKNKLKNELINLKSNREYNSVMVFFDVDPH